MQLFPAFGAAISIYLLAQPTVHAAATIVWPEHGDTVPGEFTVEIALEEVEFCDIGGCYLYSPDLVLLYDMSAGAPRELARCGSCPDCDPCTSDLEANFDVALAPGTYELAVRTDSYLIDELSESVTVTVPDEGCGCSVTGTSGHALICFFGVLCALRRRRR